MSEKFRFHGSIFTVQHRPVSVVTEFMEDWEVDDDGLDTEFEEDGENSPRLSLNLSGQPNFESLDASPEEVTQTAFYRFSILSSDMGGPVTTVPMGQVARESSESVPPDTNYCHNQAPRTTRSMSRTSARSYQWTQYKPYEKAIAPLSPPPGRPFDGGIIRAYCPPTSSSHSSNTTDDNAISYQGLIKKRKTKILRHEWQEHYFTLRGTRLAMHEDQTETSRTLEYIDIDDYAIACSSNVASGKLNAAFKVMSIRKDRSKHDIAAFSFQLIPHATEDVVKLRKRKNSAVLPSAVSGGSGSLASISDGVNGTGKTHYFVVKGLDERNNWMRELMLAQALKQKGEGVEITVNGKIVT